MITSFFGVPLRLVKATRRRMPDIWSNGVVPSHGSHFDPIMAEGRSELLERFLKITLFGRNVCATLVVSGGNKLQRRGEKGSRKEVFFFFHTLGIELLAVYLTCF